VRHPEQSVGRREEALVSLLDVPATCLAAAHLSLPDQDGRELGETVSQGGEPYVYAEGEGYVAISDGRWKYVEASNKGGGTYAELLDLGTDPHEYRNRLDDPDASQALARLRGALVNRFVRDVLS
jgi:arylsulfatase A-like enzyme